MPIKIPTHIEEYIKSQRDHLTLAQAAINVQDLYNYKISKKSIWNIYHNFGIRRGALSRGEEPPRNRYPKFKRTKEIIQKARDLMSSENPPTYDELEKILNLSRRTIAKLLKYDI